VDQEYLTVEPLTTIPENTGKKQGHEYMHRGHTGGTSSNEIIAAITRQASLRLTSSKRIC
jgi:hypothetical protein